MGMGMLVQAERRSGDFSTHPSDAAAGGGNRPAGTTEGHGSSQAFSTSKVRPMRTIGIWKPNCRSHLLSNLFIRSITIPSATKDTQKEWAQKPVLYGAVQHASSLEVSKVRRQALSASPRSLRWGYYCAGKRRAKPGRTQDRIFQQQPLQTDLGEGQCLC